MPSVVAFPPFSSLNMKSAVVEAYREHGKRRDGSPRFIQVHRLMRAEANMLVSHQYAEWRGRKQTAVTVLIPQNALLLFVGQMRLRLRPEARGLDSKTHATIGQNPWKGVRHVRNEHYSPAARKLTSGNGEIAA